MYALILTINTKGTPVANAYAEFLLGQVERDLRVYFDRYLGEYPGVGHPYSLIWRRLDDDTPVGDQAPTQRGWEQLYLDVFQHGE